MEILQAIFLGIIQGFTAWIPVSSKTQVILWGTLLYGISFKELLSFAIAVHVGDIIASLYIFRNELVSMLSVRPKLSELRQIHSLPENKKLFYFMALSVFFSGLVGVPVYLTLRHTLNDLASSVLLALVGSILIIMGIIMYVSRAKTGTGTVGLRETIITGAAQGLAVLPGISRSGITESALLLQNVDQTRAVRLSFLMGLPMIAFAVLLFNFTDGYTDLDLGVVIAGILSSTITAYLTMSLMIELAKRIKFHWFAILLGLIATLPFLLGLMGVG